MASTGDLPAGLEAALVAGPEMALAQHRQGHVELGLVLLFHPRACIQPHTHAHAILLALL